MSIPPSVIGRELPVVHTTIERGPLRFFAESIGEHNPVYSDLDAARDAGYRDLPVPPTFLFGLKLIGENPLGWISDLGADLRFVLHGSQRFDYRRMVFAGDDLALRPRIADIFEKRGSLEFVIVTTSVTRGEEEVAELTETIVIRHPEKEVAA